MASREEFANFHFPTVNGESLTDNLDHMHIHEAVGFGDIGELKTILSHRPADVNLADSTGATPIHYATVQFSNESILVLTGMKNLDPNMQDNSGDTALHWGCTKAYNRESFLTLLYDARLRPGVSNEKAETPLHTCILKRQHWHMGQLMEMNASRKLSDGSININQKDARGNTALMYAVRQDDILSATALLDMPSIEVDLKDGHGRTALMLAKFLRSRRHGHSGSSEMERLLLGHMEYDTSQPRSRIALILNNNDVGNLPPWDNQARDMKDLNKTLHGRGFKVFQEMNRTRDQMIEDCKRLRDEYQDRTRLLVVCILTHGGDSVLLGADGHPVAINEIFQIFSDEEAPHLIGVPKVFFLCSCRQPLSSETLAAVLSNGRSRPRISRVEPTHHATARADSSSSRIQFHASPRSVDVVTELRDYIQASIQASIPGRDFLVIYPVLRGSECFPRQFVPYLVHRLESYHDSSANLCDIIVKVNADVNKVHESVCLEFHSTLTKTRLPI